MEKLNALIELTKFFSSDESLLKEIQLAFNQPLNYLNQFKEEIEERGIDSNTTNLPWFALIHGLERRELLQELDWKEDPEEIIYLCKQLTENNIKLHNTLDSLEPLLNDDIEEFLPILNNAIKQHNIQLIWLDSNSDSYPLTILYHDQLIKAKELALKAGYGSIKN